MNRKFKITQNKQYFTLGKQTSSLFLRYKVWEKFSLCLSHFTRHYERNSTLNVVAYTAAIFSFQKGEAQSALGPKPLPA
jgi:hypothetical protein